MLCFFKYGDAGLPNVRIIEKFKDVLIFSAKPIKILFPRHTIALMKIVVLKIKVFC